MRMLRLLGGTALLFLSLPLAAQPIPIAEGLLTPIGIEVDEAGNVWVAERGTGADDGRISVITPDGTVHPFLVGVPSRIGAEDVEGLSHLALVGDDVWASWSDEVAQRGGLGPISRAGWMPGDAPKTQSEDVDRRIDIATYSLERGALNSNPYGIAPGPDGALYVTDAGANTLLRVDPASGAITTVAAFAPVANPTPIGPPVTDAVPTGVVWADGRLYVATLTGFPFNSGAASVHGVETDGTAFEAAGGLTNLTDLATDTRDGARAALRFAEYGFDPEPGFVFGTGHAGHLGDGRSLAAGLPLPTGAAFGPDGTMYVSTIIGVVFRVDAPAAAVDSEMTTPYRIDAPAGASSRHAFEVVATNATDAPMEVDVWAVAEIVGIDERRVVNEGASAVLAPGESATARAEQTVPASGGDRTIVYTVYVGDKGAGNPAAGDGAMAKEHVVIRQAGAMPEAAKASAALPAGTAEWLAPEASGALADGLTAAPNPATGALRVGFALDAEADVRLSLHDALGREVAVLARGPHAAGAHTAQADLAGLAPGVYVLRLASGGQIATRRVTVVR